MNTCVLCNLTVNYCVCVYCVLLQLLPEQQRSAELLHQLEEAESALRESQAAAARILQQQQAAQAEVLSLLARLADMVAEGEKAEALHQQQVWITGKNTSCVYYVVQHGNRKLVLQWTQAYDHIYHI